MNYYLKVISVFIILICPAYAANFAILSWNVESDRDTNPNIIAKQLAAYQDIDFFALSEVNKRDAQGYFGAINQGRKFNYLLSRSGKADKLQIIFNKQRFKLKKRHELMDMTYGNPHLRGALIAEFQHRQGGNRFYLMLNHLYRSDTGKRHAQSKRLHRWVKQASLPVIAVGDYNYDWQIGGPQRQHDTGYDLLTRDGVLSWVKPKRLYPTHCSKRYRTILDFVFVSADIRHWPVSSEILHTHKTFCRQERSGGSDHRPLLSRFQAE